MTRLEGNVGKRGKTDKKTHSEIRKIQFELFGFRRTEQKAVTENYRR